MTTSSDIVKFITRQLRSGQYQRGELTQKAIAKRAKVNPAFVCSLARKLKILPPGMQDRLRDDPSPEEIEQETAKLREDWDEDEYRERAGEKKRPVEITTIP